MSPRPTVPSPDTAAKYREVVRLRTVGLSFDDIATRVGYASRSGAHDAYRAALKWWGTAPVEEARALEEERVEHLWRSVMARLQAVQGGDEIDTDEVLGVVNTAVKVLHRKAALLGLDAPRQVELANVEGSVLYTDIGQLLRERLDMVRAGTLADAAVSDLNGTNSDDPG